MESDSVLIVRAKENKQYFSELYEKYFDRVFKYFAIRTGDKDLSDDLTSQTFLRAFDKFDLYKQQESSFGSWLFKIGHNLMVDHFRRNKDSLDLLEIESEMSSNENIEESMHFKLLAQEIYSILDEFNKEEKEIILLKLISRLTFQEIAKIIGKTENTIKTKYFRNLKILKSKAEKLALLIILIF